MFTRGTKVYKSDCIAHLWGAANEVSPLLLHEIDLNHNGDPAVNTDLNNSGDSVIIHLLHLKEVNNYYEKSGRKQNYLLLIHRKTSVPDISGTGVFL